MPKKTYIFMISDIDRKRHEHITEKGKVVGFVVQYETRLDNLWIPIDRYDTAHGYAHKDLMNPDGGKDKVFLGIADLNSALTIADQDINENWERYKTQYLGRIKT